MLPPRAIRVLSDDLAEFLAEFEAQGLVLAPDQSRSPVRAPSLIMPIADCDLATGVRWRPNTT
jgi:hypothetical protein